MFISRLRRRSSSKKLGSSSSEKNAQAVKIERLRQEVAELQHRKNEVDLEHDRAQDKLAIVTSEESAAKEELSQLNISNTRLLSEIASVHSEANTRLQMKREAQVDAAASQRAEQEERERRRLNEAQDRLASLREEHTEMLQEAKDRATMVVDSDHMSHKEEAIEELTAQHGELLSEVRRHEAANNERAAELQAMREAYNAKLQQGSEEAQQLAAIREQNERLAEDLPRVMLEVRQLQAKYWETVPFRGIDPADLEQLWRRKHAADTDIAELEQEVAEEKRAADAAAMEVAAARRRLEKVRADRASELRSQSIHQAAATTACGALPLLPPPTPSSREFTPHRDRGGGDAGWFAPASTPGSAHAAARQPPPPFAHSPLQVPVEPSTVAAPIGMSDTRSAATWTVPAMPATAAAPVDESVELYQQLNSALRQAAASQEMAQVEAKNMALRQEIAALRERAEQRRLHEEIAALERRNGVGTQS